MGVDEVFHSEHFIEPPWGLGDAACSVPGSGRGL